MLQSIQSHRLAPTNHRGTRIVARTSSGHRLVTDWDYALNAADNHVAALTALAEKLDWIQGHPNDSGPEFFRGSRATGYISTRQPNFLVGSTDKGYVMVFR